MIKLIREGNYTLIETAGQTKILTLDSDTFAWVNVKDIGEILIASHKIHKTDCVLAKGVYKMYSIKDEPKLADITHLELSVGDSWQGYLLLTGLPTDAKKRNRIIPTNEIVTK